MNLHPFTTAVLTAIVSTALLVVGGCEAPAQPSISQADQQQDLKCPDCAAALDSMGWCAQCDAGYAKGLKTTCPNCLAAIQSDGWCADCRIGYVAGQKATCTSCFAAMSSSAGGWCSDCSVGYAKGLKTKCPSCLTAIQSDGWCEDCKVGYVAAKKTSCKSCFEAMSSDAGGWCNDCGVGYASGLKTKCRTCFAAIPVNGTCPDCGVRFQDGRSFQQVALHVEALDSADTAAKLKDILGDQQGVSAVSVDAAAELVRFEIETTKGATPALVIDALATAGYTARVDDR